MTSPFIPCPFQYNDAPQGGSVMPTIIANRDPTATDTDYSPGYTWLSDLSQGGTGNLFVQEGFVAGVPTWTALSAGAAGGVSTISGVSPVGGNINMTHSTNQIVTTPSLPTHEVIFSLSPVLITPGSIETPSTIEVGTDLTVHGNAVFDNDVAIGDDLTVMGDLTVSGAIVLAGLTVAGTVNLNVTGNAATNIGNSAGSGLILIQVPSGDLTINGNANDILIGQDAAANHIIIGSTTGAAGTIIKAGTDNLLLTGAVTSEIIIGDVAQTGKITLGLSTAGQDIDIANGATTSTNIVSILSGTGTSGTAQILLGNNPRLTIASLADIAPSASRTTTIGGGTVVVAAVTDTIDIGPDGATTNANSIKTVNVNTGGVTLGQVLTNIATGTVTSGTHTTSIATGNWAAGTMAVNLLTGTGTKSLSIGNSDALTTTTIRGPLNLNASINANTAINSGTSTGTVTVGNSLAGAVTIDSAAGISLDAATASNFTVTGVADLTLSSVGGSVVITGTEAAVDAIQLNATTALGGIDINAGTGGITIDSTGAFSIDGAAASNVTVTGAGIDLTLSSVLGSVLVSSTENAALAIRLHADGGTSETIQIHSDQGTGVASIGLLSDVGGLTLRSTGLASADAINLEAVAGGIDMDSALQTNITSSQAAATAIQITASDAAGGITLTATGTGNINLAGNVLKSTAPAFLSYLAVTATNKTGTGTAYTLGTDALTEVFDRGSNATTAGVFTAPVTGLYLLKSQVTLTGCTIATTFVISIVATSRTAIFTFTKAAGAQDESISVDSLFDMTATNTAHVTIAVTGEGADTVDILGAASLQTYFTGYLVA